MFTNNFRMGVSKWFTNANRNMTKTAGILIIGDEILKGHTQDSNSHFLCKILHSSGVKVKRIAVIGDEIDEISKEVQNFSKSFDYVLTSGGIGPTHDDKTLEAVAAAFDEKMFLHPQLLQLCTDYFGEKPVDSPELKMAHVPQSAILHFGTDTHTGRKFKFPLIAVGNVYLFPGIPSLLEKTAVNLKHLFKGEDNFYVQELLLNDLETTLAGHFTECQKKFSPAGVTIGSYPDWFNNYYKIKLIIESTSMEATNAATEFLKSSMPENVVVKDYVQDPISLKGEDVYRLSKTASTPLHSKVSKAISIIEETLERYAYNEICIGFNGGKDCTALLHLFYAVIFRKQPQSNLQISSLYVKDLHPFEEVNRFMEQSRKRYNLSLLTMEGQIKPALEQLKIHNPQIKAVLMGTRSTDPYSRNLSSFTPTDNGWPEFMRVNPMLDWSYHDIWEFLRTLWLPYCVLYDHGYTSLGSRENTRQNEKLKYLDENSKIRYRPAYTLQNVDFERNGRL